MTPMQQLLNQLRDEREKLPMPIEWDRCYQSIEMMIKSVYLPMEQVPQQEISDEEIEKAAWEYVYKHKINAHNIVHWNNAIKWYREQL